MPEIKAKRKQLVRKTLTTFAITQDGNSVSIMVESGTEMYKAGAISEKITTEKNLLLSCKFKVKDAPAQKTLDNLITSVSFSSNEIYIGENYAGDNEGSAVTPTIVAGTTVSADWIPPTTSLGDNTNYYYQPVEFTVSDNKGIQRVTLDGNELTATNGVYSMTAGGHLVVTDTYGNSAACDITIDATAFNAAKEAVAKIPETVKYTDKATVNAAEAALAKVADPEAAAKLSGEKTRVDAAKAALGDIDAKISGLNTAMAALQPTADNVDALTKAKEDLEALKALGVTEDDLDQNSYANFQQVDSALKALADEIESFNNKLDALGTSFTYEELLNRLGIANSCATSDAMNHIWNMVQLGENWYHVDITWDDPSKSEQDWPGHVGHTYFLNSDAKITSGNHYGWESEHLAEDTAYDTGKYWQDTSSAVIFEGTTAYYLTYNGRALCQRDADGTQNELKVLDHWTLANGGWYNYCFGMLSRYGKKLYFNDQHKLYSLDPASGDIEVVYTYTGEDADKTLYGSYCTNGKAELLAAAGPNSADARTLFTIDLPKEESDEIEALNGYTITNGVLTGVEPKTSPLDALQNLAGGEITVKDAAGNTVDPAQTTKTVGTGWTFGLGDDGETGKITALIYGDVNGDGKITIPDMVAIRKHIMRVKMLDGIYLRAGAPSMSDAEDPTPSMWDMVRVRKYIMNVSDKVV